jgi:hypothetical protein
MTLKLKNLCNRAIDTSTCIEVFGCYIRHILHVPMPALAFSASTTNNNYCTFYYGALKRCTGVVKNAPIQKFLSAMNKSHPWDNIQRVTVRQTKS